MEREIQKRVLGILRRDNKIGNQVTGQPNMSDDDIQTIHEYIKDLVSELEKSKERHRS